MDVIEKIKVLRRCIENGGGCSGIGCEECKQTVFACIEEADNLGCEQIHEKLGIPFDLDVRAKAKDTVILAKQELIRILKKEHKK
jgi:hypothetical protein